VDGALVSCGFGTAYEALLRLRVCGQDRLLITGLAGRHGRRHAGPGDEGLPDHRQ
jgi:D-arabinose 1-dehydrogenase-like Zn-dependent alcohol dehydrogenase